MLSLGDPKWRELKGGYKVLYDASVALLRLERGEIVWDELWEELHHQGDVGDASYAAVPHLVRIAATFSSRDWNLYGLVSTIEIERHRRSNPPLPEWIADSYHAAWQHLLSFALHDLCDVRDGETLRSILGAVALAKGDLKLGALLSDLDNPEISEVLEQSLAWSSLYR